VAPKNSNEKTKTAIKVFLAGLEGALTEARKILTTPTKPELTLVEDEEIEEAEESE